MRNFMMLFGALYMLSSMGNAQEIRKSNIANENGIIQLDEKIVDIIQTQNNEFEDDETLIGFNTPNRDMWDVNFWFPAGAIYNTAIATDGVNFYTGYQSNFYRYNMDGSNPVNFTIPGITNVGGIAYDGEYFYTVNHAFNINKLDLANETFISSVGVVYPGFPTYMGLRGIAFDPNLDDGNGGFWIMIYLLMEEFPGMGTP